jgi:hypothetical protein
MEDLSVQTACDVARALMAARKAAGSAVAHHGGANG